MELPIANNHREHGNLRRSGELVSKPKDELFGIDLFCNLQKHDHACPQPYHHRLLIVVFQVPVNWHLLQIVPALGLTWIAMVWLGYLIAMMCVRYRDTIQVITTWLTILFYVTPVMWKPDFLPPQYHAIIDFNPLAQFLEILRNPFLGEPASSWAWLSTAVFALGGGLIALAVIGRYQHRIIFWM